MRLKRYWVRYSLLALLLVLAASGGVEMGRLLLHSTAPLPDDPVKRAVRALAYHRISCPDAHWLQGVVVPMGVVPLQCQDADRTQYIVAAPLTCSERLGCCRFDVLCWDVEKIPDTGSH